MPIKWKKNEILGELCHYSGTAPDFLRRKSLAEDTDNRKSNYSLMFFHGTDKSPDCGQTVF